FTLAEVRTLVSGFDRATPASARWQTMARRKLADVEARIERAVRMKVMLEGLLQCAVRRSRSAYGGVMLRYGRRGFGRVLAREARGGAPPAGGGGLRAPHRGRGWGGD